MAETSTDESDHEARLALATIVQRFDVDVPDDELDDLRVTPTLRPGGSVDATTGRWSDKRAPGCIFGRHSRTSLNAVYVVYVRLTSA